MLTKVSTPTISRFESGTTDIQLDTALKVLGVLGMVDRRQLVFDEKVQSCDFNRDAVAFQGKDGEKIVRCSISKEALDDHFGGDGQDLVKRFLAHRERIENEARRKYLLSQFESDGTICVKTDDI